jgi:hypothetical protein
LAPSEKKEFAQLVVRRNGEEGSALTEAERRTISNSMLSNLTASETHRAIQIEYKADTDARDARLKRSDEA